MIFYSLFSQVLDIKFRATNCFVQYKQRKDAERALQSPEAIMGNRFIETNWAKFDNLDEAEAEKRTKESQNKAVGRKREVIKKQFQDMVKRERELQNRRQRAEREEDV